MVACANAGEAAAVTRAASRHIRVKTFMGSLSSGPKSSLRPPPLLHFEVLPDLLKRLRIDDVGVRLLRLFFRVEHERDGSAGGPERGRIEYVEAFVDGL